MGVGYVQKSFYNLQIGNTKYDVLMSPMCCIYVYGVFMYLCLWVVVYMFIMGLLIINF